MQLDGTKPVIVVGMKTAEEGVGSGWGRNDSTPEDRVRLFVEYERFCAEIRLLNAPTVERRL
jgi:hypothetical protein